MLTEVISIKVNASLQGKPTRQAYKANNLVWCYNLHLIFTFDLQISIEVVKIKHPLWNSVSNGWSIPTFLDTLGEMILSYTTHVNGEGSFFT